MLKDERMFNSRLKKYIEAISEILLLLISVLIQQFLLTYNDEIIEAISTSITISICLLILLNLSYVTTIIV